MCGICSAQPYRRKVANHFFRSKHPTIPQSFWNTLYIVICRLSISVSIIQLNYKFDIRHLSLITLSFCFLHIFQNVNYGVLKQKKKLFKTIPCGTSVTVVTSTHFVYCFIALVRIRVDLVIVMSYYRYKTYNNHIISYSVSARKNIL
jgi:hypothetical protein